MIIAWKARGIPTLAALAVGALFLRPLMEVGRLDVLLMLILVSYFAVQGFLGLSSWTLRLVVPAWLSTARDSLYVALYIAALGSSLFGTQLPWRVFAEWQEFTAWQLVRLSLGLLLTVLLPGYALLQGLVLKHRLSMPFAQKLVLGFIFSVGLNTVFQFLMLHAGVPLAQQRLVYVLVTLLALAMLGMLHLTYRPVSPWTIEVNPSGILLALVVAFYVLLTIHLDVLSDRILVFDFAQHVGRALSTLRTHSPSEELTVFNQIGQKLATYPPFFGIFWVFYLNMTGAPGINAAYVLDPVLKIAPILAFYGLARSLLPGKPWFASLATTIYFLFGGFVLEAAAIRHGVADLLWLRGGDSALRVLDSLALQNSDMGFTPIYYEMIAGFRPLSITFAAMLVVLRLFLRPPAWPHSLRMAVVGAAAFVGLSTEVVALVVFSVVILPGLVLMSRRRDEGVVDLYVGMLMAMAATVVLDALSPVRFFLPQWFFWTTVGVLGAMTALEVLQRKGKIPPALSLRALLAGVPMPLVVGPTLFLYFYAWAVWWTNEVHTEHFSQIIPWYHFPVRLGVAGLASTLAVVRVLRRRTPEQAIVADMGVVTVLLFIFVKAAPMLEQWTGEVRLSMYPYIGVALIAATVLTGGFQHVRAIFALILSMALLGSGFAESVLTFRYWGAFPGLPTSELTQAQGSMEYLFRHRELNAYVTAVDRDTRTWSWFSGAFNNHVPVEMPLYAETDPLTAIHFLRYWNVGYIFDSDRGTAHAERTGLIRDWGYRFAQALPVVYSDAYARIRKVPSVTLPRPDAPIGLLYPDALLLRWLAGSNAYYDVFLNGDDRIFRSKIIAISEPLQRDLLSDETLDPPGPTLSVEFDSRWKARPLETGNIKPPRPVIGRGPIGDASVSVFVDTGGRYARWMLFREFPAPTDTSMWDELRLWWLGRGTGATFRLWMITGGHDQKRAWLWKDDSVGWRRVVFDLSRPDERAGDFSSTRVTAMGIELVTPNVNGAWAADRLTFETGPETQRAHRLIQWVIHGGTLIVGGIGPGPLQRLLGIEDAGRKEIDGIRIAGNPVLRTPIQTLPITRTRAETTQQIGNYMHGDLPIAALAYARQVGKGKVLYVDLRGLSEIQRAPAMPDQEDPSYALTRQLLCGVEACHREDAKALRASPIYDLARGLRAQGRIAVNASFAGLVIHRPVRLRTLYLDATHIAESGTVRARPLEFGDAMLLSLTVHNGRQHRIQTDSVAIGEENMGPYVVMATGDRIDWRGEADEVRLQVYVRGRRATVSLRGQFAIRFDVLDSHPRVVVRAPFVTVDGRTWLNWAILHRKWRPRQDTGLVWETRAELQGVLSFQIDFAGRFLHLANREFSGNLSSDGRISETRVFSPDVRARELRFDQPRGVIMILVILLPVVVAYLPRIRNRGRGNLCSTDPHEG